MWNIPERTVKGDRSHELDTWILATAPRATAYARSLLRNPHEAEDIVQDCYCRLLAKADVYDLPHDGMKLLLRAITNACINLKTRRKPFFRLVRTDAEGSEQADDPMDKTALPPDERAMFDELSVAVESALRTLPTQQCAAVQLKALGHSQQEIAEIMGVTTTNVGVLIHRARQALTARLYPYLGEEAIR